jgi:GDP-4-dehydro-6-deoxy-D-mannose reductase
MLGYQYYAQFGLPVVRVRAFSHTGPGQDARFVVPGFAKQLAEVEIDLREPTVRVGNLNAHRDFSDVRDIVRAYRIAAVFGCPGEVYNVGRGTSVRIGNILDDLISQCCVPVRILVDAARLRPVDVSHQQADTTRFRTLTGWQPEIPWSTTLNDTFNDWRARLGAPLLPFQPTPHQTWETLCAS